MPRVLSMLCMLCALHRCVGFMTPTWGNAAAAGKLTFMQVAALGLLVPFFGIFTACYLCFRSSNFGFIKCSRQRTAVP